MDMAIAMEDDEQVIDPMLTVMPVAMRWPYRVLDNFVGVQP
jgi:hypothetical protein